METLPRARPPAFVLDVSTRCNALQFKHKEHDARRTATQYETAHQEDIG